MTKEQRNKKILTLISILASIFIYVGAVFIYLYANGWRLDLFKQKVVQTGVLTVESDPFLATLTINGESKGRTPRSASLDVGEYDISVKREGYIEWNKKVEIKEEKSTNIYPWLIRENITKENISTITDRTYIQSWENEKKDRVLILTNRPVDDQGTLEYEIWLYTVNTTFWDLSSNPKVVLSFQTVEVPTIQITPSPAGTYWLLAYTQGDVTTTYLLDISRISTLENLSVLNISQFNTYTMTWAKNSQYLMFESDQDLISFDIQRQSRYLLIRKAPGTKYMWSTDEQGYFYTLETNTEIENENVYAYTLTQEEMDGSNPKILVNDLFFQKNKEYIEPYKTDNSSVKYSAFTNSTASTRSVGKIEDISVNQNAQGIYIKTEVASYWYNMRTKRYHLVSPYISDILLFAPDNSKFIFKDTQGYWVFTFLNEDNDPTVEIGSKIISNTQVDTVQMIGWLSNSMYIYFIENNNIYISDKDGENKTLILSNASGNMHYEITSSREHLCTISSVDNPIDGTKIISIDRYLIH